MPLFIMEVAKVYLQVYEQNIIYQCFNYAIISSLIVSLFEQNIIIYQSMWTFIMSSGVWT